jgi:hypothetical protein
LLIPAGYGRRPGKTAADLDAARTDLALWGTAVGTLATWLGFSSISSDSSGPAAHEAVKRIVEMKTARHTNGVEGILLNIPFLPARNVGYCINRKIIFMSRKNVMAFQ